MTIGITEDTRDTIDDAVAMLNSMMQQQSSDNFNDALILAALELAHQQVLATHHHAHANQAFDDYVINLEQLLTEKIADSSTS